VVKDKPIRHLYTFGPYSLDVVERILLREDKQIPLQPKVFDTLLALVERHGHVVRKEELMELIWPDTFVEEINLAKNISILRKTLSADETEGEYIQTIPKRGYRFVGAVQEMREEDEHSAAPPAGEVPDAGQFTVPDPGQKRYSKARRWSAVLLLVLGAAGGYWFYSQTVNRTNRLDASAPRRISRITTNSNAFETAISPDGRFVAYVLGEFGTQSLWVKQVASNDTTQLIPAAETRYRGLTFSPDGSSLYFARRNKNDSEFVLYRLPLIGGTPTRVLAGVHSVVTFSPDGTQIAFVREYPTQGESALVIATADGSSERKLAVHKSPTFYSVDGPAWSPDGNLIAAALGNSEEDFHYRIVLAPVAGGAEQALGKQKWAWAMRVCWLADGKGLVLLARDKTEGRNNQVWQLSYPGGEARKVVSDLNDYRNLSLTADSNQLVTIQSEVRSDIWVAPVENINRAARITSKPTSQNGYDGLDWSPDNKLVYTSLANGRQNLWIMNADGSQPKQLMDDLGGDDHYPSVSGDGRYVVFTSKKSGAVSLWRVDIDGSNPKQLTYGNLDLKPNCSPDGQWVVYSSEKTGTHAIRKILKVGIDGGQAVQLTDKLSEFPVISPDGKLIACLYQEEANAPRRVALLPLAGGAPVGYLDIPLFTRPTVRWYPDGRSLSYLNPQDDSSNIWLQPLSAAPPTRLTNFESERIFAYAWSRDGRYLACARGLNNRDVVMISGFK